MKFTIIRRDDLPSLFVEAERFSRSPLEQSKGVYEFYDEKNKPVAMVECDAVVGVFEEPKPQEGE